MIHKSQKLDIYWINNVTVGKFVKCVVNNNALFKTNFLEDSVIILHMSCLCYLKKFIRRIFSPYKPKMKYMNKNMIVLKPLFCPVSLLLFK